MKRKKIMGLLLTLLMILLIIGCGDKNVDTTSSHAEEVEIISEQTFENNSQEQETIEKNGLTEKVNSEMESVKKAEEKIASTDEEKKEISNTQNSKKVSESDQKVEQNKNITNNNESSDNKQVADKNTVAVAKPVKGNITLNKVTLLVTKDYGREILFNKKVEIKSEWTVIDLLENNLEIETKWDGSFVASINGFESENGGLSGKRLDWFYYVNGICADVGAGGYTIKPGEVIWWDYHTWESMGATTSAVIGSYPEPFLHGYGGKVGSTNILSSPENQSLAAQVQKSLEEKGVKVVNMIELSENIIANREVPTIVLGEWNELKKINWLDDFNRAYRKTGACMHFTENGIELLKNNNEIGQSIEKSAGVVIATGEVLGDSSPLWLVIGTDTAGLQQAVNILTKNPEKFTRCYNAAIISGEVIGLPIQ